MTTIKSTILVALTASVIAMGGCMKSTVKPEQVQPVSANMSAHPLTPIAIGTKRVSLNLDGTLVKSEMVSIQDGFYKVVADNGHEWTNRENIMLPSPTFSGPDWGEGSQELTNVKGSLYPLQVGNKMSFDVKGVSTKWPDGWQYKRSCEVQAQEQITVKAGSYDAFRIVCDDRDRSRVMYFAPSVNDIIWFRNVHKTDPSKTTGWEIVE